MGQFEPEFSQPFFDGKNNNKKPMGLVGVDFPDETNPVKTETQKLGFFTDSASNIGTILDSNWIQPIKYADFTWFRW